MCKTKTLIVCGWLLLFGQSAIASDHLLYFEAQEIFGYASSLHRTVSYSINPQSEMQHPSLGFDYLQRLSGETGDWGVFSLQGRVSVMPIESPTESGYHAAPWMFNEEWEGYTLQPQIYNAWLKVRTPWAYVWIGHDRPAFGLASYFDSHGLLLETVGMRFGFPDRDWGVGGYHDYAWGTIAASLTSGTGMPLYQNLPGLPFTSHYMTAARASYGVLERDNFNAGFSLAHGKNLETIGYDLMQYKLFPLHLAGTDLTVLQDSFEHRFELYSGQWFGSRLFALFYRFGVNLDPEARYKLEAQYLYWKAKYTDGMADQRPAVCFSAKANEDLTVRASYAYDRLLNDNRFLLQLYYYAPWHIF